MLSFYLPLIRVAFPASTQVKIDISNLRSHRAAIGVIFFLLTPMQKHVLKMILSIRLFS